MTQQRLIDATALMMKVHACYINSAVQIMQPDAYKTAWEILDMIGASPTLEMRMV